jgi:Rps23 Pro-64 3,4-dihydroxylase Tpa1-like proline 4-hydroxylase
MKSGVLVLENSLEKLRFSLQPQFSEEFMESETLTLCCCNIEIRIIDNAELGLCQRLGESLPPEFTVPGGTSEIAVTYVVMQSEASEFLVTCDDTTLFATDEEEEVYEWLRRDIDLTVARRAPQRLFVHAGVVGWRGVGIVIPGRAAIGKTTLVAELVRRGAVYYSDTFAIFDAQGRLHPYRNPIELDPGGSEQPHNLRLIRDDGSTEPLPLGLIVSGAYTAGVEWRPTLLRGPQVAGLLVDDSVLVGEDAVHLQQIAVQAARDAVALCGPRAEAEDVATLLLDLIDDALVSRGLDANGDNLRRLADDLARVAELRLNAPDSRVASPPRRLEATPYVRITDFLTPEDHARLLASALAWEQDFTESGVFDAMGQKKIDHMARKSRTLTSGRFEELWEMFDQRLRSILPVVRQQLGIPWFPLVKIERQLTAHGRGGFFVPHVDTGDAQIQGRRISCVYYFHRQPKPFRGGELKLYDTWVTPTGNTGAGTYTALAPIDNSIVFFSSDAFHEVCPVETETDAFADSRFTVTIWFWEPTEPTPLISEQASTVM